MRTVGKKGQMGRIWCRLTFLSPQDQAIGSVLQRLAGGCSIACEPLRRGGHLHIPPNHHPLQNTDTEGRVEILHS